MAKARVARPAAPNSIRREVTDVAGLDGLTGGGLPGWLRFFGKPRCLSDVSQVTSAAPTGSWSVSRREDTVGVVVEDDGVGFDAEWAERGDGLGRVGMRERTEAVGGTFTVESSPGAGTTEAVEVPCVDSSADRR